MKATRSYLNLGRTKAHPHGKVDVKLSKIPLDAGKIPVTVGIVAWRNRESVSSPNRTAIGGRKTYEEWLITSPVWCKSIPQQSAAQVSMDETLIRR